MVLLWENPPRYIITIITINLFDAKIPSSISCFAVYYIFNARLKIFQFLLQLTTNRCGHLFCFLPKLIEPDHCNAYGGWLWSSEPIVLLEHTANASNNLWHLCASL